MSRRRGNCCCSFYCPEWVSCLPEQVGLNCQQAYRETFYEGEVIAWRKTISQSFAGTLRKNNPSPQIVRGTTGQWSYSETLIEYQRATTGSFCITQDILRERRIEGSGSEANAIALIAGVECFDPCQSGLNAHSRASVSGLGLCDFYIKEPDQAPIEGQQYYQFGMGFIDTVARCLVGGVDGSSFSSWVSTSSGYPPTGSQWCPQLEDKGFFCKDGLVASVVPIMVWEAWSCPVDSGCGVEQRHVEFSSNISIL